MGRNSLKPPDRDPHTGIDHPIPSGNARRWAAILLLVLFALTTIGGLLFAFL
ncbi:hypothetical protein [Halovivax cerinus]|uniref:Uncharacterized protein n=1 Tax=Halovivax cerinus TaxID=1487865 RepID=A0ABD5NSY2_9EURY|nr:hypothetical protein [Halovivax cerinus]